MNEDGGGGGSVSKALIIKIRSEKDNVRDTQTATVDVTFTSSPCGFPVGVLRFSTGLNGMMKLLTFSCPNMSFREDGKLPQ